MVLRTMMVSIAMRWILMVDIKIYWNDAKKEFCSGFNGKAKGSSCFF